MTQPTAYSKTTNFAQDEANNVGGRSTVRTSNVDAEFRNIETTLDETLRNLALIQRDDGQLRDGLVELYNLSLAARIALQSNMTPRGTWVTAASYVANDMVESTNGVYVCLTAHLSGVFATDLAAGKWQLLSAQDRRFYASPLPADPATRPDGSAIQNGDWYFNSVSLVWKEYNGTEWFAYDLNRALLAASGGSALVGFLQSGTGAVTRTAQNKMRDFVCVFDFFPNQATVDAVIAGTSTADLSSYVQAAVNTGKAVYLPGGTYKFNIEIANKSVIFGDGSTKTIVKPYDDTKAAMLYTYAANNSPIGGYWHYHSEVRDIGFFSNSANVGVGFSFGKTIPSAFVANDQLAGNVKFYGCLFKGLDKGVQFPFGNIGTEFYSCGWIGCTYGLYMLNAKFGGATMHAGNKYIYGGQFDTCRVAIYYDSQTDHGGAVCFYGTVLESCNIVSYINSQQVSVPFLFDGCWIEDVGQTFNGGGNVTIDSWSGSTLSTQVVAARAFLLDGAGYKFVIRNSGNIGDIRIRGTSVQVDLDRCRVECFSGYGGNSFTIDDPTTSFIHVNNPTADGGWGHIDGMFVTGIPFQLTHSMAAGSPTIGRVMIAPPRCGIVKGAASKVFSHSLTRVAGTSGSFALAGSLVADGRIYPSCNEFTRAAFLANEYTSLSNPNSSFVATAGWYVVTVDVKVTAGSVKLYVWDRAAANFVNAMTPPTVGRWFTLAAIAKAAGGETLFLDFNGTGVDATWRVSAYQVHRFDNFYQAAMFLQSGQFAAETAVESIASAATITIPYEGELVSISGTTSISAITAIGQSGQRKTLVFADALTVVDGGNLKLNGNFVTTADDTITLVCDGTNWFEVSRSAN